MPFVAVVLAAGQGTRMKSALPKVLHPLCGRPLVQWVIEAAAAARPDEILVVVGHGADRVTEFVESVDPGVPVRTVVQPERRGTGDAMLWALRDLAPAERDLIVVPGDMPLIRGDTLRRMVDLHDSDDTAVTLLTADFADPTGYGRVVRMIGGTITRIVEEVDANPDQRQIPEVAVSTYIFDEGRLREVIDKLGADNAKGEIYLTDVIERLIPDVDSTATTEDEVMGINDRVQLAQAETLLRQVINERWMRAGVTMRDPDRTYVDVGVELAQDVTLLPNCVLEGATRVGAGTTIGPDVRLVDTVVGSGCALTYCVVRESQILDGSDVGPFASLRAGNVVGPDAHIGTYVELKKSVVGAGSKVPHLSYVGDATIGVDANLGANTITCNWDGRDKWPTTIGDGVRTGSGTLLVAPVTVGDRAYTAAGSVVTRDVPPGAMAKGMPARNDEGWTDRNR